MTEPGAGSDVNGLKTKAVKKGNDVSTCTTVVINLSVQFQK